MGITGLGLYNHVEVMNMIIPMNRSLITEYDEEKTLAFLRKESYEEGFVIGLLTNDTIIIMKRFKMSVDKALDLLGVSEERRAEVKAEVEKEIKKQ